VTVIAGGHRFPIRFVHWRQEDDFFLVECEDGGVFVWQLGTGHLDRVATGVLAEDILAGWVCWSCVVLCWLAVGAA
jgi:hypothetical protein